MDGTRGEVENCGGVVEHWDSCLVLRLPIQGRRFVIRKVPWEVSLVYPLKMVLQGAGQSLPILLILNSLSVVIIYFENCMFVSFEH